MNKCVLIVDDDQEFSSLLRGIFQQAGYTVHTALDADLGLELLQREPIQLVVTDERLPGGMSGSELIHKSRELDLDIPVIMVSGYLNDEAIRDLIRDGVDGVFIKPLNIFSLLKKSSDILEQRSKQGRAIAGKLKSPLAHGGLSIGHIQGLSDTGKAFLQRARNAATFKRNLLLIGPAGTLFEEIGRDLISLAGPEERCLSLKPGQVSAETLEKPFAGEKADQPITLIVLDAEYLSQQETDLLVNLVDERGGAASSLRMIFCLSRSVEELYDSGKIDDELYLFLGTNELIVPPLKSMPEDLVEIARRELSERSENAQFDMKLRSFLLDYSWPENMLELRSAIVRAISLAQPLPPQVKHFEAALKLARQGFGKANMRSSLERFLVQEKAKYLAALAVLQES